MRLGYYDLSSSSDEIKGCLPEKKLKVEKVIIHEKYRNTRDSEGKRKKRRKK